MGQFQLFPLILLLVINYRHVVGTSTPNLTCYFGPSQNIDELDPFLCTKIVANAIQTITQEGSEPRIDINSPRLAKLVALKIVNPELQLFLGIDAPNTQALLQIPSPDALAKSASQFGRLLTAVLMDGIDFEYDPPAGQNAIPDLTKLFSTFQPIFAPLTVSLTVPDSFGPTPALSKLNIDHVHVLPSAKPSLTPEREDRQISAKIEPWLKSGFQASQLSAGLKIGGVSWRQDLPQGPYVIALERVSRAKICRTLQTPDWQTSINTENPDNVLAVAQSGDGRQKFTYPSEKKISKLIQKVVATVGGIAVVDADLDDAQNECGKGPWAFIKLVRDSMKLPSLKEQGGVTRIRLKLNLGTMQDVGIFRWLNDDTETPLRRTRRHDSWSKRDRNHDHSDNRQLRWFQTSPSAREDEPHESYKSHRRSRKGGRGRRKFRKPVTWDTDLDEPELRFFEDQPPETEKPHGDQQIVDKTTTTEIPPPIPRNTEPLPVVAAGGETTSTTTTTKAPVVESITQTTTTIQVPIPTTVTGNVANSNAENDKVSTGAGASTDSQGKRAKREVDLWPKRNRNLDRFNDNRQPRLYAPHASKSDKLEFESYKVNRRTRKGHRGGRRYQKPNSEEIELRSLLDPPVAEPEIQAKADNAVEVATTTTTEPPVPPEVPVPPKPPVPVESPVLTEVPLPPKPLVPVEPPVLVALPTLFELTAQPELLSLPESAGDRVTTTTATPMSEGEQDKQGNEASVHLRNFEALPAKRGAKRFFSKPGPADHNTRPFRRQTRQRRSPHPDGSPDFGSEGSILSNGGTHATDPADIYYIALITDPHARTSAARSGDKRETVPFGSLGEKHGNRVSRAVRHGKVRNPGLDAPHFGHNHEGQVDIVLQSVLTTTTPPPLTTDQPHATPGAQLRCGGYAGRARPVAYPHFYSARGGYGRPRRSPIVAAPPAGVVQNANIVIVAANPTNTKSGSAAQKPGQANKAPGNKVDPKNKKPQGQASKGPNKTTGPEKPRQKNGNRLRIIHVRPRRVHLRRRRIGNKRSKDLKNAEQSTVSSKPVTTPIPRAIEISTTAIPKPVPTTTTTSNPTSAPLRPSLRNRVRREIKRVPHPVTIQIIPQKQFNRPTGRGNLPVAVPVPIPVRKQRVVTSARPKRNIHLTHDPEETDIDESTATSDQVADTGYQASDEQEYAPQGEPQETDLIPEEGLLTELEETDLLQDEELLTEPEETDWLQEDDFNDTDLNLDFEPGNVDDLDALGADEYAPDGSRRSVNSFEIEPRAGKIDRQAIRDKIRQQLQAAAAQKVVKRPMPVRVNRTRVTTVKLTALQRPRRPLLRPTTTKEPPVIVTTPVPQPVVELEPTTTSTSPPPPPTPVVTTSSPVASQPVQSGQSRYVNRVVSPSIALSGLWANRNRYKKTSGRT